MRSIVRCVLIAAVALLTACTGDTTVLLDGSSPGCPEAPPSESNCATAGQVCHYHSANCADFRYECQVADGGSQGTWMGFLCD